MRLALFHERHFGLWQSLAPSIDFHCAHFSWYRGMGIAPVFFSKIFGRTILKKLSAGPATLTKKFLIRQTWVVSKWMPVSAAEEVDVFVFQTILLRHSPFLFLLKASEAEVVVA